MYKKDAAFTITRTADAALPNSFSLKFTTTADVAGQVVTVTVGGDDNPSGLTLNLSTVERGSTRSYEVKNNGTVVASSGFTIAIVKGATESAADVIAQTTTAGGSTLSTSAGTLFVGQTEGSNLYLRVTKAGSSTFSSKTFTLTVGDHTTATTGVGGMALTADSYVYSYDGTQKRIIGQIQFNTSTPVQYEPGTAVLRAPTPTVTPVGNYKKEDFYVKNIMYTAQAGQTGCTGNAFWTYSSGDWNKGVNKTNSDNTSRFVACKYDVVAEVGLVHPPADAATDVAGVSEKKVFQITPKPLTASMVEFTPSDADKVFTGEPKKPTVIVKDGNVLAPAVGATDYSAGYYFRAEDSAAAPSWTNAGTARLVVEGRNNYSGLIAKTWTIAPREIDFSKNALYTFRKEYDGSQLVTATDSAANPIVFGPYPTAVADGDKLTDADYVIKAGTYKYNDKNVGNNRTVSATVELAKTVRAGNYKLKNASFATGSDQQIVKGTVTEANVNKLVATNPKLPDTGLVVKYTGKATTVAASWATGVTNPSVTGVGDGKVSIVYGTEDGKAPVEAGTYDILVNVNAGGNLNAAAGVKIGTVKIDPPGRPKIVSVTPDTFYYATKSVTLEVKAENPKDGKTTGLSYQWYRQSDTGLVAERGKTAAKFVVNDTATGTKMYVVAVTYKGTDQATSSDTSNAVQVEVRPAPVTIKGAVVTANTSYEYTGSKIVVTGSDLSVQVGSNSLAEGTDYTIKSIANNTNAGVDAAVVTLAGINGYKDEVVGTFTITRKAVTIDDLQITYGVDYTGETQEIVVRPVSGKSGLGIVTPTYAPADTARVDAGSWTVTLAIADGQNFTGIEALALTQPYTIRKVLFDEKTMLKFDSLPKDVAWNGKDQGIGAPTLEGLGKKYTGSLRVVYERNGEETTTAIDSGVYRVKLSIGGDKNFSAFEINLGVLTIHDKDWVGVAQKDRVIPGVVKTEEAAVAPVKTVSASVTVGPNPVASNGKVTFFWNGNTQVTGKLIVFTNVGRKVASINVKGAKEIGSWNVNGVAEGTYLVKGVLREKNGGKVGVSTVVGVTK